MTTTATVLRWKDIDNIGDLFLYPRIYKIGTNPCVAHCCHCTKCIDVDQGSRICAEFASQNSIIYMDAETLENSAKHYMMLCVLHGFVYNADNGILLQ